VCVGGGRVVGVGEWVGRASPCTRVPACVPTGSRTCGGVGGWGGGGVGLQKVSPSRGKKK
jgi:hypothetical protein